MGHVMTLGMCMHPKRLPSRSANTPHRERRTASAGAGTPPVSLRMENDERMSTGGDSTPGRAPADGRSIASRDSYGGSSSDDSQLVGGHMWMEDPSRKRWARVSEAAKAGSLRMSTGSANAHAAHGGGKRPLRSPRPAIVAFNIPKDRSVEKSVKEIVQMGHMGTGEAEDVAAFLEHNDGKLDPAKVADYLGGEKDANKEVLRLMLDRCDFSGLPLDTALRKMIALIKLPGEAQKIDRIVSQFANRYMACNPDTPIDHEDTAGILAFSLVMLNVDAHNANIAHKKKMTEQQYVRNVRGVCKDGASPELQMVRGFYSRVTRYEWSVEERTHTPSVHEGWVTRRSSKKLGGQSAHLYAVLTTRGMYFYHGPNDTDPDRYIRLEGLGARRVRSKGTNGSFELYALNAEGGESSAGGEKAKEVVSEGRMIKLSEQSADFNGPRKTISRHSSCFFACDSDKDAALWVQLIRDFTYDDGSMADESINHITGPLPVILPAGRESTASFASAPDATMALPTYTDSLGAGAPAELPPGGSGGSLSSRERRATASRNRFSVKDSLKMLERKYAGVEKRTAGEGGAPSPTVRQVQPRTRRGAPEPAPAAVETPEDEASGFNVAWSASRSGQLPSVQEANEDESAPGPVAAAAPSVMPPPALAPPIRSHTSSQHSSEIDSAEFFRDDSSEIISQPSPTPCCGSPSAGRRWDADAPSAVVGAPRPAATAAGGAVTFAAFSPTESRPPATTPETAASALASPTPTSCWTGASACASTLAPTSASSLTALTPASAFAPTPAAASTPWGRQLPMSGDVSASPGLVSASEPEVVAALEMARKLEAQNEADRAVAAAAAASSQAALQAQEATLASLMEQCGAAESHMLTLRAACQRRRVELGSVDAALSDARIEMQRAKSADATRTAELHAQRRQLQNEAIQAAEASANHREEAERLREANTAAREELASTREALHAMRQQTASARSKCDELTSALTSTNSQLVHSRTELDRVMSQLADEQRVLTKQLQHRTVADVYTPLAARGATLPANAATSAVLSESTCRALQVSADEAAAASRADLSSTCSPMLSLAERIAASRPPPNGNTPSASKTRPHLEAPRALLRSGGVFLRWADGITAPFLFWLDETVEGDGPCLTWRSPASSDRRPPVAMRLPLSRVARVEAGWGGASPVGGGTQPTAPPAMLHECGWSVTPAAAGPNEEHVAPLLLVARDKELRDVWVAALGSLNGNHTSVAASPARPAMSPGMTPGISTEPHLEPARVSERLARVRQGRGRGRSNTYARQPLEIDMSNAAVPQFRPPELAT